MHNLEALLFIAGSEGLLLTEIATHLQITSDEALVKIAELEEHLTLVGSALQVVKNDGHYLLSTRSEYAPLLKDYTYASLHTKLSRAALEVLAIIAYQQPITRIDIDEIRGVQSSAAIQKLLARHLIEVTGRVDGPGRPQIFGTTAYFLEYFGIQTLDELPDMNLLVADETEEDTDLFFNQFNETFDEADEKGI